MDLTLPKNIDLKCSLFGKSAEFVALSYDPGCRFTDPLWPGEADHVSAAVAVRKREYVAARSAARRAMSELQLPLGSIGRTNTGAPIWPAGVIGSLSHGAGDAIAVVGSRSNVLTVGIDLEAAIPLPAEIASSVVMPEDQDAAANLSLHHPKCWQMVIFSAKEAFYKAFHQCTADLIDFDAVFLQFNLDEAGYSGDFHCVARDDRLNSRGLLQRLSGRWLVHSGRIYTAILAIKNSTANTVGISPFVA
ncbi:4'-phosphopantetheinyl transferase superfamily protein [Rhizobium leguminosarum]|uniref:4'-phosphopantetheinyl transferase family protein n=1 Tax=Rhizobium leguminosarum TaxID=384 RepID=UPI001C941D26|nr:4'-phosphopantetheinyl transferase superfamily protein [Rhizobium leguminosarum]MBY5768552.1 4'-phosphopantetheinyl transferase superfamily protein [Rhizobium leguminosarum]